MIRPHRGHPLWLAYILHRLSGLALAMFLPAHFYVLSLVFLLAVHFFGGLRLMAFEFLDWSKNQKTWAAAIVAFAFMIASGFLLRAI